MENNHSRTWPPTAHTRSQSSSTGPSAMSGNIWWVLCGSTSHKKCFIKEISYCKSLPCICSGAQHAIFATPLGKGHQLNNQVHHPPFTINDIGNLHQINHPAIPAGHVLDEPIWSVEQVKESCPNRFLPFPTVVPANKQFCK